MVAGAQGSSVAEKSTLPCLWRQLCHPCHVRCQQVPWPLWARVPSSVKWERQGWPLWFLPALRLTEVGYIGSFSEILRKIILLQRTLQNKWEWKVKQTKQDSHWSKSFQNDPPQWRHFPVWNHETEEIVFQEWRQETFWKQHFSMMHHHA